jgi:ATP-dependent RNA helicase DDX19/DBP5
MADLASRISKPAEAAPGVETPVEAAQVNSAGQGASNLQDVDYDVEVSLNKIQENTDHPLGSAHTFQELGL